MALFALAQLNTNCNSNVPGNVNPEFKPNEGCGCTLSYNGGAGAGTATCCDDGEPYEEGFNDKKRDQTCCSESSRLYQAPLANKKPDGGCSAEYKYVPEFNYPVPPCAPEDSRPAAGKQQSSCCGGNETYQGGLTNKKPECSAEFKYVVPSAEPQPKCFKGDTCCVVSGGCSAEPDTYESIANTDAQRYKGKGPDRSNFYADDDCGCQSNNSSSNNYEDTDWSEIRRYAYAAAECSDSPKLARRSPSFYCEEENYVKNGAMIRPRMMAGSNMLEERSHAVPTHTSFRAAASTLQSETLDEQASEERKAACIIS